MKTKGLVKMADELDVDMVWINKKTHGTCNLGTGKIQLNIETMVVEVFIHEAMHLIHPLLNHDEDEEVIDTLTNRFYKKLSKKQIRLMAKKLLRR